MASVKVAVRVRPLNGREEAIKSACIIEMNGDKTSILSGRYPNTAGSDASLGKSKSFTFDFSYWSADSRAANFASQEQVFNDLGVDVVESAYGGYNACVFAYGQTGSGKTHTMTGSTNDAGLIPRICEGLYSRMGDRTVTYKTEISYLEIYNERVRDLLRNKANKQVNLKVREHPKDGPYVQDLSKHLVMTYTDMEELMRDGQNNRTTAATQMNDVSSRSHAIFTIYFTQAKLEEDMPSEIHSKIHLVDLAGSERVEASGTSGQRLKEGSSINKSLVTLGNVISALADMSEKQTTSPGKHTGRHTFIPYRDSVLTWLLKDSLGGNSKTIMIATISPADINYAETLSTLRYANRAKRIINKPTINEDPNVRLIRELREENARLRALLGQNGGDCIALAKEKICKNEEKIEQLTERWAGKWSEAVNILEEHKMLALRREGSGVVLDSELPYLLALDDNILSTGIKLYHLKEGTTTVGREDAGTQQDIILIGRQIEAEHCVFNHLSNEVSLVPIGGALCSVNNNRIQDSTKLGQGAIIRLGRGNLFRFNHPLEAAKLREEMGDKEALSTKWQECPWNCSTLSVTDSAFGGSELEFDLKSCCEDIDKLEEKRKALEKLQEEHAQAEATRLAQLAEQEANKRALAEKEEHLKQLCQKAEVMKEQAEKAQLQIKELSLNFEREVGVHFVEQERLQKQQERIQRQKEKLDRDKAKAREERQKLRKQRELERARLSVEREQQLTEWEQIGMEKKIMEEQRNQGHKNLEEERQKILSKSVSDQELFENELCDMRSFVREEVNEMRRRAGLSEIKDNKDSSDVDEDKDIDVEKFKLEELMKEVPEAPHSPDSPPLPLEYLLDSPDLSSSTLLFPRFESRVAFTEEDIANMGTQEIHQKLDSLSEQVKGLHTEVCGALHRKYNSVLSADDIPTSLGDEVLQQFACLRPTFELLEKIAHERACENHDSMLAEKLQTYDLMLTTVDQFLRIHETLKLLGSKIQDKKFLDGILFLDSIQNILALVDVDSQFEGKVLKVLQTEVCVQRERLLFELTETWDQLLHWTIPVDSRKQALQPRTASLRTAATQEEAHELLECVTQAMQDTGLLESRIQTFCDKIMSYLVESIVQDRNALLQVVYEANQSVLCIVQPALTQTEAQETRHMVPPEEVYQKLEQVFLFIHGAIRDINYSATVDKKPEISVVLSEKIGSVLCHKLFDYIFNECLSHAIPKTQKNWEKFREIVAMTEKFQESLKMLGFLPSDHSSLLDYFNNVNSLFVAMKNQEVVKKAHELMTQDLRNTVQICSDHPMGRYCEGHRPRSGSFSISENTECFVKQCKEQAGTTTYRLPVCKVSVAIRSLMCLVYESVKEALACNKECAFQICCTIQNMFELYCDVVPSYHQDRLKKNTLIAALHHNNCMFVAHHLLTIDKLFQVKFEGSSKREIKMDDLKSSVRRLGNESFTQHVNSKKTHICQHLADAQGFECVADDDGQSSIEAIKAMLTQLDHISNIWRDVLPSNSYLKAVGSLLDAGVADIIEAIITIEEFSADDCECLQKVLQVLADNVLHLFYLDDGKINPEVALHENVSHWMKFRELIFILGSNIKQVSDRWADGKGPLAVHFPAEEVRHLVVAMFENTSNRDNLLKQLR